MIGLPLTLLLTISISLFYFFQRKSLTFIENSIVYMMTTILTTNVITILSLNFKVIKTTENPFLFPAILLYRDGIIPLLVLILINVFLISFTLKGKCFYFILIFACLYGIEVLMVFLDVFEYKRWNFLYSVIVNAAYLLIGLGIAKMVLFVSKRSLKSNDSGL
jgi:hypothetical protein